MFESKTTSGESDSMTGGSGADSVSGLASFKAMYLGSEPMGELLEGENGSDAIQTPLRRIILRTSFTGQKVNLKVTENALNFMYQSSAQQQEDSSTQVNLPIELLAYCGALRQLAHENIVSREFETLDKAPQSTYDDETGSRPPLFVTIFRCIESENMLFCHAFVLHKDEDAMELVRLVMEVYYNLVKMSEEEDELVTMNNSNNTTTTLNNNEMVDDDTAANNYLKQLLHAYNNISMNEQPTTTESESKSMVSIIREGLNRGELRLVKTGQAENGGHQLVLSDSNQSNDVENELVALNQDPNPIIIKKQNNEEVVYKQNVYIRWLQPPTPPPPAPIIIREVQEQVSEDLPPLVIYKQAPRAETPPPLVIRERPPTPPEVSTEPLIIERRVSVPEKHRKIIIEHLPAPPPKPRDIILEKWLPPRADSVQQPRQVFIQKAQPSAADQLAAEEAASKIPASLSQNPPPGILKTNKGNLVETRSSRITTTTTTTTHTRKNKGNNKGDSQQRFDQRSDEEDNDNQDSSGNYRRSSNNYPNQHHSQNAPPFMPPQHRVNSIGHATAIGGPTGRAGNHRMGANSNQSISPVYSTNSMIGQPGSGSSSGPVISSSSAPFAAPHGKIAGYKIVRQIIPGANMSASEVQQVLARSKPLSTTVYSNHYGMHDHNSSYDSPSMSSSSFNHPHYHSGRHHHHHHPATNPIYYPSPTHSTSSQHRMSYQNGSPMMNGPAGSRVTPMYPNKVDIYLPHNMSPAPHQQPHKHVNMISNSSQSNPFNSFYSHLNKREKYHRCASSDQF